MQATLQNTQSPRWDGKCRSCVEEINQFCTFKTYCNIWIRAGGNPAVEVHLHILNQLCREERTEGHNDSVCWCQSALIKEHISNLTSAPAIAKLTAPIMMRWSSTISDRPITQPCKTKVKGQISAYNIWPLLRNRSNQFQFHQSHLLT